MPPDAPPPARPTEPHAPAASPYRQIATPESPLPSRLPPPASSRAALSHPRLRAVALIGSLLAHTALLAASAVTPPASAAPTPSHPVSGFDPYLVRAEPLPFYCPFPPEESLAACFTRAELRAAGECTNTPYCQLHGEIYGHDARNAWTPIPYPFLEFHGDEAIASDRLLIDLSTCAGAARQNGWTGQGHVFVRVTLEAGGGAVAQAFARDSAADDPGLLCCLRNAQLALASTMRPGTTVRYDFSTGPEGIVLTPPPL